MNRFTPLLVTAAVALAASALMGAMARAEDCPKGVQRCQVLIVTPEETQTLVAPGGIFDQALWANRSGMSTLVDAWKRKLESAPAGTVKAEEPPKEPAK